MSAYQDALKDAVRLGLAKKALADCRREILRIRSRVQDSAFDKDLYRLCDYIEDGERDYLDAHAERLAAKADELDPQKLEPMRAALGPARVGRV